MNLHIRTSLIALAMALPAPLLAQSVQDFQLPPAPAPTARPQVEGPVDEDAVVPRRPRVIPTARPTPRATVTLPAPTPTATPPATRSPTAQPTRRPSGASAGASAQPRIAPASSPIAPRETPLLGPAPATGVPTNVPAIPLPTTSATPSAETAAEEADESALWPWLAGLAALLIIGGGAWFWRRRRSAAPPPAIEPPLARAAPTAAQLGTGQTLTLRAEAIKLTRSLAFATLDYRLTLINRTDQAMTDLAIAGDLVSAHGGAPMEEQVALPTTELPARHAIARLAPGQSRQISGQVQLPLGTAQIIRQGRLPLLVPLLRIRIDGAGAEPLARTFVIGQGVPDGGRLQPFRLDDGPRSYQPIAQRPLDVGELAR